MINYEAADLVISVVALAVNFAAVAFVGWEVRQSRTVQQREDLRKSREATLNYYASTLEERNHLRDALKDFEASLGPDQHLDFENPPGPLLRYLGYWEMFATGVNVGVFDFECAKSLAGARIEQIWKKWSDFAATRREMKKNGELYRELEYLAEAISKAR